MIRALETCETIIKHLTLVSLESQERRNRAGLSKYKKNNS